LPASPPSLASDSAANSSGDAAGPDAATLATASHVPTPSPLLTQLSQALGESNGTGKATSEQNVDDATDALGAPSAATDSSVDATSQSSAPTPSAAAESQTLHTPVGTAAWGNELGARLTVMAQQGISSASLRLSPAHLGPLDVRISVRDNTATVYFGAQQSDTRAALEQALPRLRELFAQQGLNLTHAGVSGETPQSTPQNGQAAARSVSLAAAREVNVAPVTSAPTRSQGLIDTYA
jgi:flagellar hook-length control protein FliK